MADPKPVGIVDVDDTFYPAPVDNTSAELLRLRHLLLSIEGTLKWHYPALEGDLKEAVDEWFKTWRPGDHR